MLRSVIFASLALAGSLALCIPAGAAMTGSPCRAPGRIVVADRTTAITQGGDGSVYGCTTGHRRRALNDVGAFSSPSVRKGFAAYAVQDGQEVSVRYIYTVNLATGKKVRLDLSSSGLLIRTVALATGRTAFWVGERATGSVEGGDLVRTFEVHRLTGSGTDVLLDQGVAIDPGSLAVTPTGAYWVNAKTPRTSRLG